MLHQLLTLRYQAHQLDCLTPGFTLIKIMVRYVTSACFN